jgi:2-polyprenyl-3-methyl-5-hydroxy-6-metoxy-1,4-benzoquinol methylase
LQTRNTKFDNYFETHAGNKLSLEDTIFHARFVESQLKIIDANTPLSKLRDDDTLEIGSGIGRLYYLLKNRGFTKYTGLELDQAACDFTNNCFGKYFIRKPVEEFTPDDGKLFKSIWAFEVLEHVENPTQVINKISKLLSPGGVFIGTTPYPFAKNIISDRTHISVLHPTNWQRLFKNAGFTDIYIRPMTFIPLLWRINPKLNFVLPFYLPGFKLVSTTLIIAKLR